jgi:hypothetical protein
MCLYQKMWERTKVKFCELDFGGGGCDGRRKGVALCNSIASAIVDLIVPLESSFQLCSLPLALSGSAEASG